MSEASGRPGIARRQWAVLIVLFVLSLPAVTPRIYSSDEIQYFSYLRSLWFDGDVSFENEYQYFYDRGIARGEGFHETFLERSTATGRRINFATMGCAILWAPFYAIGDLWARASGAAADGFSKPYIAAVAYGSAVYACAALLLAILSAARFGLHAFAAALVVWLGTPLLFYGWLAPPYSHACSAFAVSLFIYVWLRVRGTFSPRGLLALGVSAALMTMVREQDAFVAVPVAVDWLMSLLRADGRKKRELIAAGAIGAIAGALVYAPQAIAYLRLNGHVGPHSSVGAKMNWVSPHALQVLFSPEHGFFVWTPLALVALIGLARLSEERGRFLILMVLLQVYVSGAVESWTVAGAFGQRRFVALTAIMIIGYAALQAAATSRGARIGLAAVTALCVYWNLAMIAEFATGLMDRQKLEPRRNAYDAFVTLPVQAPSLVYRFLFDRASFYRSGVEGAR